VRELDHLATHSNVMYRVVTNDGRQLVLRVGDPFGNSRANIEYEVAWLAALNRETDLDVVNPISTGYGALIVDAREPESNLTRPCVLFSWVPGVPLAAGSGAFGYRLLGSMCASLQLHGKSWQSPNPDGMRRWDRIFYYDQGLDPVIIYDSRFDHVFSPGRRTIIEKAGQAATNVINASWEEGVPQGVIGVMVRVDHVAHRPAQALLHELLDLQRLLRQGQCVDQHRPLRPDDSPGVDLGIGLAGEDVYVFGHPFAQHAATQKTGGSIPWQGQSSQFGFT